MMRRPLSQFSSSPPRGKKKIGGQTNKNKAGNDARHEVHLSESPPKCLIFFVYNHVSPSSTPLPFRFSSLLYHQVTGPTRNPILPLPSWKFFVFPCKKKKTTTIDRQGDSFMQLRDKMKQISNTRTYTGRGLVSLGREKKVYAF